MRSSCFQKHGQNHLLSTPVFFFSLILFLEGSVILREISFLYFFCFNSFEEERPVGGCSMSLAGSPGSEEPPVLPSDAHSRCSKTPVQTDRRTSTGAPSAIRAASVTVAPARPLPTGRPAPPARAGPTCARAGRRQPHRPSLRTRHGAAGWPTRLARSLSARTGRTVWPRRCHGAPATVCAGGGGALVIAGSNTDFCACVDSVLFSMRLNRFGVNICVL